MGKGLYPTSKELLIIANGGGSNGARNRLWKMQLQQFATETGLSITVFHLPPAWSQLNKIEHRLFSYISINERGKHWTSFETVIELISHTTTKQGWTITAIKDTNVYPTGIKVSAIDYAIKKGNAKQCTASSHSWTPNIIAWLKTSGPSWRGSSQ